MMSSDDRIRKLKEDYHKWVETDSANDTSDQNNDKEREQEERRKFQNRIRCQRYRDKKKIMNATVNSQISNPQTITAEEKERIERRRERYRQASQRYRDRKRMNLMSLHVDQWSRVTVKRAFECQGFHNSQNAGLSARDVPYISLIQTNGLSTLNNPYSPETHSDVIIDKRKFQSTIRCQLYRDKKNKITNTIDLQVSNPRTLTVEEEKRIEHGQERNKQASQHYRDLKRMNLNVDQCSGIIVKHDCNGIKKELEM